MTGFDSIYCGYHSETAHATSPGVRYAFIPFLRDLGSACGSNSVNAQDEAFGYGYLDGYSVTVGHEYAEAVTDPDNFSGYRDGWNDVTTSENGDKCAWKNLQNRTLSGQTYAVQPLRSKEANGDQGGCVVTRNYLTAATRSLVNVLDKSTFDQSVWVSAALSVSRTFCGPSLGILPSELNILRFASSTLAKPAWSPSG